MYVQNTKNSRHMSPKCRNEIFAPAAPPEPQPKILLPLYQFPIISLYWWHTSLKRCASCPNFGVGFLKSPVRRWCALEFVQLHLFAWSGQSTWARHLVCPTWVTKNLCQLWAPFPVGSANSHTQARYFYLLFWFVQRREQGGSPQKTGSPVIKTLHDLYILTNKHQHSLLTDYVTAINSTPYLPC